MRDICFVGDNLHSDGAWIDYGLAGGLTIDNCQITNALGTSATPNIRMQSGGTNHIQVIVNNVRQANTVTRGSGLQDINNGATFVVISYTQTNSNNQNVASTQLTTI